MRLALPIVLLALAAALVAGCGDSGEDSGLGGSKGTEANDSSAPAGAAAQACALDVGGTQNLRAAGVSCGEAQRVALGWQRGGACALPAGTSRSGCSVRSYRCLAAVTDRGLAVSCGRPGRSVAFLAPR